MELDNLNAEQKLQKYLEQNEQSSLPGVEYIPNTLPDIPKVNIAPDPPKNLPTGQYKNMQTLFSNYTAGEFAKPAPNAPLDMGEIIKQQKPDSGSWNIKRASQFANLPKGQDKIVKSIEGLTGVSEEDKYYLKRLAQRESTFNPNASITDKKGRTYEGLYQFGKDALGAVGISRADYLGDVNKQHLAALKFGEQNIKGLEKYIGTKVKGVKVTKAGMMAAAHLGGRGGLKALLEGKERKDMLGTSTLEYLKMFEN